jgi:hypothetical protein
VSDTGPGIGPELREKVFEPYVHGGSTAAGFGLGLPPCGGWLRLTGLRSPSKPVRKVDAGSGFGVPSGQSHLNHGSLPKFGELRLATRAHRGGDRIAVRRDTQLRRRATSPTMPPPCGTAHPHYPRRDAADDRCASMGPASTRVTVRLTPQQRLDLKQAARRARPT